jgi:hypothetical protein
VHFPGSERDDAAPARGRVALPVYGGGRRIGRFVLDLEDGMTGIAVPAEDRALAIALADQLGTVLVNV